jgi:hypothetical protein
LYVVLVIVGTFIRTTHRVDGIEFADIGRPYTLQLRNRRYTPGRSLLARSNGEGGDLGKKDGIFRDLVGIGDFGTHSKIDEETSQTEEGECVERELHHGGGWLGVATVCCEAVANYVIVKDSDDKWRGVDLSK